MIIDCLVNAEAYFGFNPRLEKAFAFLKSNDVCRLPVGRHDIAGDDVYALVQHYQSKPVSDGIWEGHHNFLDIQYIAEGQERIGYLSREYATVTEPYDEKHDEVLYTGEGSFVTLSKNHFAILAPQDVHMPGIFVDGPAAVQKIVIKVRK